MWEFKYWLHCRLNIMKLLKYTPKNILLSMDQAYTFISTRWPMHQIILNTSKDLIDIYEEK